MAADGDGLLIDGGLRLSARVLPSARHALAVRIDVHAHASSSVDFIAAQLVGYCSRADERRRRAAAEEEEEAAAEEEGASTALVDEARASQCCVLASAPLVVAAGFALEPDTSSSFVVRCARLPTGLPPSFEGGALWCEYMVVVTVRTMVRVAGWWEYLSGDEGDKEWVRGPLRRLRVPVHVAVGEVDVARWPGAAMRCELSSEEALGLDLEGWWGDDDDEEEGDDDDEEEEGNEAEEAAAAVAATREVREARLARFDVQLDGAPLAAVELASSVFVVGGAVRGVLRLLRKAVGRVVVALLLEECEEEGAVASSRVISKSELSRGGEAAMSASAFELPILGHLPASSELCAADGGVTVELRWVVQVTFEVGGANAGANGEARIDSVTVPWRAVVEVRGGV